MFHRTLLVLLASSLLATPALAGDKDKDGISNKLDACKAEPENFNGFRDDDGCPDELALLVIRVVRADGNTVPAVTVKLVGGKGGSDTTNDKGVARFKDLMPGDKFNLDMVHRKMGTAKVETLPLESGKNQVLVVFMGDDGPVEHKHTPTP